MPPGQRTGRREHKIKSKILVNKQLQVSGKEIPQKWKKKKKVYLAG